MNKAQVAWTLRKAIDLVLDKLGKAQNTTVLDQTGRLPGGLILKVVETSNPFGYTRGQPYYNGGTVYAVDTSSQKLVIAADSLVGGAAVKEYTTGNLSASHWRPIREAR